MSAADMYVSIGVDERFYGFLESLDCFFYSLLLDSSAAPAAVSDAVGTAGSRRRQNDQKCTFLSPTCRARTVALHARARV